MSPIERLPEGEKERFTVQLPVELVNRIRKHCINKMFHNVLIHDAVVEYLSKKGELNGLQTERNNS